MAGDWIAVEYATPRKPEILAVSQVLGLDPDVVFARWFKLWCWADENLSSNGHAVGVTITHLDEIVGISGFSEAFLDQKWLKKTPKGIRFVRFSKRNSKPGKVRLLAAKRKRREREQSRDERDIGVTTEQNSTQNKKKKQKKSPPIPPSGGAVEIKSSNAQEEETAWGMAHDLLVENVPSGKWPEGKNLEAAMQQVAIRLEGGETPEMVAEFVKAWGRGEIQGRNNLAAAVRDRYTGWKKERG